MTVPRTTYLKRQAEVAARHAVEKVFAARRAEVDFGGHLLVTKNELAAMLAEAVLRAWKTKPEDVSEEITHGVR